MSEVFLSYKKEEKPKIKKIADALEAWGLRVWYDAGILGGVFFRSTILKQLESAQCVVVCWSRAAVRSNWVISEAQRALDDEKLLPVMLEDCVPPMPFDVAHTLDFTKWRGSDSSPEFLDLIEGIAEKIERSDLLDAVASRREKFLPRGTADVPRSLVRARSFNFRDMAELVDKLRPEVQEFDPDVMVSFDARGGLWAELLMDQLSKRIPILIGCRILKRGPRKFEEGFEFFELLQTDRWNLYLPKTLEKLPRSARVLYIDDYSNTGETCDLFRSHLVEKLGYPPESVRTLTLITTPRAKELGRLPDLYGESIDTKPRLFYMSLR